MKTRLLASLIMIGLLTCPIQSHSSHAQENPPMPYEIIHDLPYHPNLTIASPRHVLDLYRPTGLANYPILLFVHGGAWVSGDKSNVAAVGQTLATNGIGVAAVNYRLSPEVTHPAHIQDIALAFAWVAEHIAEYGGDSSRTLVGGHSAGGHLTTLLALDARYLAEVGHRPAEIFGVISFSGVYMIEDWIMGYADDAFPDDQLGRYAASPYVHVHADTPPMLLLVARNDYPQLIGEAKLMTQALEKVEVAVELYTIPNRDHYSLVSMFGSPDDTADDVVLTWLKTLLKLSYG